MGGVSLEDTGAHSEAAGIGSSECLFGYDISGMMGEVSCSMSGSRDC